MADRAPQAKELTLLCKLLKMTTSNNDGEALVAIRKANEQLAKVGGDWEKLFFGKVTVIADPFENLRKPPPAKAPYGDVARPVPQPPWTQPAPAPPPGSGFTTTYPQSKPRQPYTPRRGKPPGKGASASTTATPQKPRKTWQDIKNATIGINDLD